MRRTFALILALSLPLWAFAGAPVDRVSEVAGQENELANARTVLQRLERRLAKANNPALSKRRDSLLAVIASREAWLRLHRPPPPPKVESRASYPVPAVIPATEAVNARFHRAYVETFPEDPPAQFQVPDQWIRIPSYMSDEGVGQVRRWGEHSGGLEVRVKRGGRIDDGEYYFIASVHFEDVEQPVAFLGGDKFGEFEVGGSVLVNAGAGQPKWYGRIASIFANGDAVIGFDDRLPVGARYALVPAKQYRITWQEELTRSIDVFCGSVLGIH